MIDQRARRITKLLLTQGILYGTAAIEYSLVKVILKPKTVDEKIDLFTGCMFVSNVVVALSSKRIYDLVDEAAERMK